MAPPCGLQVLTLRGEFVEQLLATLDVVTLARCHRGEVHLDEVLCHQVLVLECPVGCVKACSQVDHLTLALGQLKQPMTIRYNEFILTVIIVSLSDLTGRYSKQSSAKRRTYLVFMTIFSIVKTFPHERQPGRRDQRPWQFEFYP